MGERGARTVGSPPPVGPVEAPPSAGPAEPRPSPTGGVAAPAEAGAGAGATAIGRGDTEATGAGTDGTSSGAGTGSASEEGSDDDRFASSGEGSCWSPAPAEGDGGLTVPADWRAAPMKTPGLRVPPLWVGGAAAGTASCPADGASMARMWACRAARTCAGIAARLGS